MSDATLEEAEEPTERTPTLDDMTEETRALLAAMGCKQFALFVYDGKGYAAAHSFGSIRIVSNVLNQTLNDLERQEAAERPQIYLPSGAGHPRRIQK